MGKAYWPTIDSKPSARLVRHLRTVHGLTVTDETRAECDEAEGWASEADPDPSCLTMLVNGGSDKAWRRVSSAPTE